MCKGTGKQQQLVICLELSETDHHQKVSPAFSARKTHEAFCGRCVRACNAELEAVAEADLLYWYETVQYGGNWYISCVSMPF